MAEPEALASSALKAIGSMASLYCTDCDAGPLSSVTSSVRFDHSAVWTKYSHWRCRVDPREGVGVVEHVAAAQGGVAVDEHRSLVGSQRCGCSTDRPRSRSPGRWWRCLAGYCWSTTAPVGTAE